MSIKRRVGLLLVVVCVILSFTFSLIPTALAQSPGSPVTGTMTYTGSGSGTYNTSTGALLTGTMTGIGTISGDLIGTAAFNSVYEAISGTWYGSSVANTGTLGSHSAKYYGESLPGSFTITSGTFPGPLTLSFSSPARGVGFTTDGSDIAADAIVNFTGTLTQTFYPSTGTWTITNMTMTGTYQGTVYGLTSAPAIVGVGAGSGTVNLGSVAQLDYSTSAAGTIVMAQYSSNPGGPLPARTLGKYIEITTDINYTDISWPVEFRVYYTDAEVEAAGIIESTLRMYRWNGTSWVPDSDSGVNTSENYVWARLTGFSPHGPFGSGSSSATGAPVFPNIYIGITAAFGAAIIAYIGRRRLIQQT